MKNAGKEVEDSHWAFWEDSQETGVTYVYSPFVEERL